MGVLNKRLLVGIAALILWSIPSSEALAGPVNLELRPAGQTVTVGDPVEIGLYAVSADGFDQTFGFVGIVVTWDSTALALTGHNDLGAFAWASSGFPSDPGGLNDDLSDGDAYYQAIVPESGGLPDATASGTLVTTLQFDALSATASLASISPASCIGATCTLVLDRHPLDAGVQDVTGVVGPPVYVTILCEMNGDCNDGNPCTDDLCDVDSLCVYTPDDTNNPDDGLFCNGREVCDGGLIIIDPDSIPDCDDGLTCTIDSCNEVANMCDHDLAGGRCLIDAVCFIEGALNPVNDCEQCDTSASSESWSTRSAGAPCGDHTHTVCNGADTCDGLGNCLDNFAAGGTSCGNSSDTICTDPDTCDGSGTCQPNNAPGGTACDDGLFCTVTDSCASGVCVGSGPRCPDQVCDDSVDVCKSVGLELRPLMQGPLVIGEVAELGLYAVAQTGVEQPIAAVNAILVWDASRIELLDRIDNGPYSWMISIFPDDSDVDGLNDTFLDGNALYQALVMPAPNEPAVATTVGLLITTFRFRAVDDGTGVVQIVADAGQWTETEIIDAETVGLKITGPFGSPAGVEVIECETDDDCNDGQFCNGMETCQGTECVAGVPPECDDGLFCNGVETCEFGIGCVSPGNPCPVPTSCSEDYDNCGGCYAPVVEAEGCRYLAVTPVYGDDPLALLVKAVSSGSALSCVSVYVQADGSLDRAPIFLTPAEWDTVHVTGSEIVPSTTYAVQADCRPEGTGFLSASALATTWTWGDVNNNGHVQIDDVTLVYNGAQGIFEGTTVENLDVAGCMPNRQVDAEDVAYVQAAYTGGTYGCPAPCDACLYIDPPQPEATVMPKNRFVSFGGGHPGQRVAVRVTFADLPTPLEWLNGEAMWVREPVDTCENSGEDFPYENGCSPAPGVPSNVFKTARLGCEPYYTDWSTLGEVHVYGRGIVPGGVYELQVVDEVCDPSLESVYSAPLTVSTSLWCDVVSDCTTQPCGPPDGVVNVSTDVTAVLDKFKNLVGAPLKHRCDLEPNLPDLFINISDVVYLVDAFVGIGYPFNGPAPEDLCP